jgi:hypothetical protein
MKRIVLMIIPIAIVASSLAGCGKAEDDNSKNVVTGAKASEAKSLMKKPVSAGGGAAASSE